MPKRFTSTMIWDEDWFFNMPLEYKLLWFYIKDKCDHAGIWKPNVIIFNAIMKGGINTDAAIKLFNSDKQRVRVLNSGRWFIEDFITFQYGDHLNQLNRVHSSIIDRLGQEGVDLGSIRGLNEVKQGVKDKDKDKDSIKGVVKGEISPIAFNEQLAIDLANKHSTTCKSQPLDWAKREFWDILNAGVKAKQIESAITEYPGRTGKEIAQMLKNELDMIDCKTCEGTGTISFGDTCPKCNGDGRIKRKLY